MIISSKNLKLYFNNGNGGIENLPEIEKSQYGYDLQPGQKIYSLSYTSSPDKQRRDKNLRLHD